MKKWINPTGLIINCDCCGEVLTKPGALLFSPPMEKFVWKYHFCVSCYDKIRKIWNSLYEPEES